MGKILTILLSLMIYSTSAIAETTPWGGYNDKRIRYVTYNENDVFKIFTQVGVATHFKFADDEVFEQWYSGDSEAFLLTNHKNYVALKPVVETTSTNMLIITNKRSYNLHINIVDEGGFYAVNFQYPQEKARLLAEKEANEKSKKLLEPERQKQICDAGDKVCNVAYMGAGSQYIKPTEVFDNGTHTFFYFPERVDIPAVYRVRRDNSERLTQSTTIGNWIVVPRVQERWTLRLGDEVLCVRNDKFTTYQRQNKSNTVSPNIIRADKE